MLLRALRTGEPMNIVIAVLAAAFLVFCVIPLHEFAHAWAADRQGDDTPRNSGRLTLSPMAHVDPIGAVLIALIGFGWGKPTPVNPRNFRNQRWGEVLVAAAGPASNLLLGWLFLFIEAVVMHISAIQCSTGGTSWKASFRTGAKPGNGSGGTRGRCTSSSSSCCSRASCRTRSRHSPSSSSGSFPGCRLCPSGVEHGADQLQTGSF